MESDSNQADPRVPEPTSGHSMTPLADRGTPRCPGLRSQWLTAGGSGGSLWWCHAYR
jgi:hypothetical protein